MDNKVHLELLFDMRLPEWVKTNKAELYETAIEMCDWADGNSFESVTLAEHHMVEDHYLSSPLILASAIASRTRRILLRTILLAPFYEPLRLAEELQLLQIISRGRLLPVVSGGYRPAEFDMFGARRENRLAIIDEAIDVIRKAGTGLPFRYRGRCIDRITPVPDEPLRVLMGGSFPRVIRRAAHNGADGVSPNVDSLFDEYRDELRRSGKPDPGSFPTTGPRFIHVVRDVERGWEQIGPHLLHFTNSYRNFVRDIGDGTVIKFEKSSNIEDLKTNPLYLVATPEGLLRAVAGMGSNVILKFWPLMAGLNCDSGWESLELLKAEVMPYLNCVTNTEVFY
jgi:alkanesulfonate monooxygenase SsuD/methylene tetrahydromethanopterin reductase-like flavin-dependent oxidoreductase (luciferase family)